MHHLTNGDVAAAVLRRAKLPGRVIVWADALHEGPAPAGLAPEEWRRVRARHLASGLEPLSVDAVLAQLAAWDADLNRAALDDELVMWFEHDLFDQLLLVRHLAWLAARGSAVPPRVSLVCIGAHPEVPGFQGLGQLSPRQLAGLFPGRETVTRAQLDLGARVWEAFTAPDPRRLEWLAATGSDALPFLAGALVRHLEEFPSVRNGLSRTEQRALAGLTGGPSTAGDLFRAVQRTEDRVFMGDGSFFAVLRRLAGWSSPAVRVQVQPGRPFTRRARVELTPFGASLHAGSADWVRANGIDRWLGGVHLEGREAAWRWDEGARRLAPFALRTGPDRAGTGAAPTV
jgi:hypothetical protein